MTKTRQNIDQAVLEENIQSSEFIEQLNLLINSIISKRYGNQIFVKKMTVELLHSAAMEGVYTAISKFNKERGNFLSYAYSFIIGKMHEAYCLELFGLTVYYSKKLQKISNSLTQYYITHDLEMLYNNLCENRIRKETITVLYNKGKLDLSDVSTCMHALEQYGK